MANPQDQGMSLNCCSHIATIDRPEFYGQRDAGLVKGSNEKKKLLKFAPVVGCSMDA